MDVDDAPPVPKPKMKLSFKFGREEVITVVYNNSKKYPGKYIHT